MAFLSFQSAHWVRRKIERRSCFGSQLSLGEKQGRRVCVWRDGCESRGLHPEVGRAVRSGNPEWGPGREVTSAGDTGGAKMASLLGQVEEQLGTRPQLGHQSNVHPWVVVSPIGAHMSVLPKRLAHSLTHNQSSHHMPYAQCSPHMPRFKRGKATVAGSRVQNQLGKAGMCAELECRT